MANLDDGREAIFVAKAPAILETALKPGTTGAIDIALHSRGVIPVSILTTDTFDATQVDATTLEFGPGEATIFHENGHIADVDGDGDSDLTVHFKTSETGIACGDTEVMLSGQTFDGRFVSGSDSINTVGKDCR